MVFFIEPVGVHCEYSSS